jgi:hypothetical protein
MPVGLDVIVVLPAASRSRRPVVNRPLAAILAVVRAEVSSNGVTAAPLPAVAILAVRLPPVARVAAVARTVEKSPSQRKLWKKLQEPHRLRNVEVVYGNRLRRLFPHAG